jgi:3-oxoacyl-[acyl-carrier protein] reductase
MSAGLLEGRTALVLGLDEIGSGIARRFAREGARVLPGDPTHPARAAMLGHELGSLALDPPATGLDDAAALEQWVAKTAAQAKRIDVLVCNLLPPPRPRPLEEVAYETLGVAHRSIAATFAAMRAALPFLRESGRGRIVLVGHRYGESVSASLGAYNSAAWSLIGLSRTAAVDWGQFQITTNVLLPLARTAEFDAARAQRTGIIDRFVGQLPLRRIGDPVEDVGGAAALLASDLMGFVNGEVLHADGGQHVAGPVLNPARFAV